MIITRIVAQIVREGAGEFAIPGKLPLDILLIISFIDGFVLTITITFTLHQVFLALTNIRIGVRVSTINIIIDISNII